MSEPTPPTAALHPSALAGIRVLDLARVLAGPWSTQILGDLGADVLKIEKPEAGDDTRSWGPPFLKTPDGEKGDAAYYLCANRNKRSLEIDFAHAEGAEIIKRLVPHCQIMVENFKTGGLAKYGLDYESVRAINPALVYCSITGFGQTGPYAHRPGYDYIVQGMGGLMGLTGEPEGEPMKSAVAVADLFTGMYATVAILAALRHAERTGQGQHIDVSLLDSQIAMLANLGLNYLNTGENLRRMGNTHASIVPYQVFSTKDGHVILAVGNDHQFKEFCKLAGLALASDPRFENNDDRVANRAELTALLAPVFLTRTTAEWVSALEAAKVPCGPINKLSEVFADPHVQARRAVDTLTRADGEEVRVMASPLRMSETPPDPRRAPPLLGQDTEDVLAALLGASEQDFAAWRVAGALGPARKYDPKA